MTQSKNATRSWTRLATISLGLLLTLAAIGPGMAVAGDGDGDGDGDGESKEASLAHLRFTSLDGETVRLSEALKDGPVILDFWATWCAPCKRAMPKYAAVQKAYAEQGVKLWAVSWDADRMVNRIAPYFERSGFEFPALLDPKHEAGLELGVRSLPTTFLVNADGTLRWSHVGFADGDERELERQIRASLGLKSTEGR